MLYLYNTLTRKKEEFTPLNPPKVGLYTCGPTVYDYAQIGNLRKYTGDDILRRVLEANGYNVKHVMNITDVGHLESDADEGEDKLEKGAREKKQSVWDTARFFEDYFFKSVDSLNIKRPDVVARATEHIEDQIALIKRLGEKGFTYRTSEAIYFDVSKFPTYTKLSGQSLEDKQVGVRDEVVVDQQKKHPQDFALWFFTVGRFANHTMRWASPWGEGFPGWHIECSAMSMKYLGETLDIHTGGVDHIPVHHTNEIAQSEGATGEMFSRFWVHHEFLLVDGGKMSKSKKNFYTIEDLQEKGFEPLSLRYLFLTAHYRDKLNFTWESLGAASVALSRLQNQISNFKTQKERTVLSADKLAEVDDFRSRFTAAANDDLNTPRALAILWEVVKGNMPSQDKLDLILSFDEVLGLGVKEWQEPKEMPKLATELAEERAELRNQGKFEEADKKREEINKMGYDIIDTADGGWALRHRKGQLVKTGVPA